ncbi:ras-associated protein rap1 isoform 1 family protein [Cystoisospora suis]|uniref:Ras-associated protein rap1 isoform 1 family protein n=1 Tax=Cystoisospora suis TaxID=483139 RepID=A0A2C6KZV4_9APIC|nr:ras-associated protein rap1 isoform 1 family protein [Cystoisospora suis]
MASTPGSQRPSFGTDNAPPGGPPVSNERLYDLLQLPRDASTGTLKKTYRQLALLWHPDKGGDVQRFQALTAAWEVLGNETRRRAYDRTLIRTGSTDGLEAFVKTNGSTSGAVSGFPFPRRRNSTGPEPQPRQQHHQEPHTRSWDGVPTARDGGLRAEFWRVHADFLSGRETGQGYKKTEPGRLHSTDTSGDVGNRGSLFGRRAGGGPTCSSDPLSSLDKNNESAKTRQHKSHSGELHKNSNDQWVRSSAGASSVASSGSFAGSTTGREQHQGRPGLEEALREVLGTENARTPATTDGVQMEMNVRRLGVKQLKQLLTTLDIPHGACIEKTDLLEAFAAAFPSLFPKSGSSEAGSVFSEPDQPPGASSRKESSTHLTTEKSGGDGDQKDAPFHFEGGRNSVRGPGKLEKDHYKGERPTATSPKPAFLPATAGQGRTDVIIPERSRLPPDDKASPRKISQPAESQDRSQPRSSGSGICPPASQASHKEEGPPAVNNTTFRGPHNRNTVPNKFSFLSRLSSSSCSSSESSKGGSFNLDEAPGRVASESSPSAKSRTSKQKGSQYLLGAAMATAWAQQQKQNKLQTEDGASNLEAPCGRTSLEDMLSGEEEIRMKIVAIGPEKTGKSCIIKRYCEGRFVVRNACTIGLDYGVKIVDVGGATARVNFFDFSGRPEFAEVRKAFYDNTDGVLLVFDFSRRETFEELEVWLAEAKASGLQVGLAEERNGKTIAASRLDLPVALLANKADVAYREISSEEASAFASSQGMMYFEVSANNGLNIAESLEALFGKIASRVLSEKKKILTPLFAKDTGESQSAASPPLSGPRRRQAGQ